jgi:hypothetical protein
VATKEQNIRHQHNHRIALATRLTRIENRIDDIFELRAAQLDAFAACRQVQRRLGALQRMALYAGFKGDGAEVARLGHQIGQCRGELIRALQKVQSASAELPKPKERLPFVRLTTPIAAKPSGSTRPKLPSRSVVKLADNKFGFNMPIVLKSIGEDLREFEGIASTPSVDRVGDIVDPMGAKFDLPLPLLLDHEHSQQVGHVVAARQTSAGIRFTARIT